MTYTDPESCLQQADPEHFYSCGGGDGGGGGGGRGGGGGGGLPIYRPHLSFSKQQ